MSSSGFPHTAQQSMPRARSGSRAIAASASGYTCPLASGMSRAAASRRVLGALLFCIPPGILPFALASAFPTASPPIVTEFSAACYCSLRNGNVGIVSVGHKQIAQLHESSSSSRGTKRNGNRFKGQQVSQRYLLRENSLECFAISKSLPYPDKKRIFSY